MTDPVTLEVVGNYLVSAVREMGTTLRRTAYSTLIREEMDCSTALFDPLGQLVAQADHVPSHQGTLSLAAKHVLATMALEPGDVVILNHPYRGGTHHPDIMIFKPVFHEGELLALAGALGHHLDVGGRAAGSISTDARDVFEEGLIIPALKLYRRGVLAQEIFEVIRENVREPEKTLGDLRAEIAAVTVGERRYAELASKHGPKRLAAIVAACLDNSERLMREDLRAYADGRYRAEGLMDGDGVSDDPVRIFVTVTLAGGHVTVDFTGSSGQVKGPFNCALSSVYAAVYCAVRYMVNPLILQNEGCYRPIDVILPGGSIVKPVPPAPLSGRFHTLERIANTIVMAFNAARGEQAVGSTHAHLSSFSVSGRHPGSARPYVFFEILGGGWGGTAAGDGLDATFGLMANCLDVPIEALELEYPLRVERYELRPDSGGAGRHRGGLGLRRDVRYLSGDGYFTNRSDGQKLPPVGVRGGRAGLPSRHTLIRADGAAVVLPSKVTNLAIGAGDLVVMETAGGGGWGPPAERDPALVLQDVLDDKVSEREAREVYGVAVDRDLGGVDARATAIVRAGSGKLGGPARKRDNDEARGQDPSG
jgi:N-methylhydantoinase B